TLDHESRTLNHSDLIGTMSSDLSAVGRLEPVRNSLFGIFNTYLPYSNQAHTKQRKGSVTSKLPFFQAS
ncbi:hypothetical protein, partial [Algoriphagus faecimaris]|uniref:hypothetical protein n=1 Tax=Algoriphagus faecimaris TaxID=686796 RepID=UPI001C31A5B2